MAYHPFRHLGLKVLAIALASLLWLTVAGEHLVERGMRVPLEFRGKAPELEIVGDPPTSVDVRISGSSALLGRLDPGEIVAVLDLSTARPGPRLFPLRAEEVRAPYGVRVVQVVPSTLALEIEKGARRVVPVTPDIEGDPEPGYVIGRVSAEPATVEVVGPESRLKRLTAATTESISIAGARAPVRDVVTIGVQDSSLRLASPQTAQVMVEVLPAPVERELQGVPVRWRNLGTGLRAQVTPTLTRVSVRGQRAALDALRPDGIDAFVDLAGLGAGRYNLRVQVDPAQNFGVVSITPAVVDVTIK
jgi:YbbR domain-containing protein